MYSSCIHGCIVSPKGKEKKWKVKIEKKQKRRKVMNREGKKEGKEKKGENGKKREEK